MAKRHSRVDLLIEGDAPIGQRGIADAGRTARYACHQRRASRHDACYSFTFSGKPLFRFSERDLFGRSEEHTSELQSLMRISYAVFCLKNKNIRELTLPLKRLMFL